MLRRLIGRRGKSRIPKTTTPSLQPNDLLSVFQDLRLYFSCFLVPGYCPERNLNDDILPKTARAIVSAAALAVFSQHILIIAEMQQGPKMIASPENDMSSTSAIAAIRPRHVIEFGLHKMLAARPAMTGPGKYPYLIYKI